MTSCYDIGCQVAAKASELIDHTPPGYVTIGGQFGDLGPDWGKYDNMPTRASFSGLFSDIGAAMTDVAYDGQAAISLDSITFVPNKVFPNLDRVVVDLDHWHGSAADAFKKNYQTELRPVAQSQFVAASVLGAALEAQIQLFEKIKENVLEIGNKTLSALEASDGRGDADFSFTMAVLVAVGTVAITVASDGAALPIALSVATGAANVGGAAPLLKVHAEDPQAVMREMYDAMNQLEQHIEAREGVINKGLSDFADAINNDLGASFGPDTFPSFYFKPTGLGAAPGGLGHYES